MPGNWWNLAAGGGGEVVPEAAAVHGAVGKVHLSRRPQKKRGKIIPLSPISSCPHIPQSSEGGRPSCRPAGRPAGFGRPAGRSASRFSRAAWPFFGMAGQLADRPGLAGPAGRPPAAQPTAEPRAPGCAPRWRPARA